MSTRQARRVAVVVACVVLGMSGCAQGGGTAPDEPAPPPVAPTLQIGAVRSPNEQGAAPTRSHARKRSPLGASSPREAVRAFAVRFITWDWRTIRRRERSLARTSVDGARAMLLDAAARAPVLERARASNSGVVHAISRDVHRAGTWIVVTRERSGRRDGAYDGVGAQWHLTLAAVRQLPSGRWAVSAWIPQT